MSLKVQMAFYGTEADQGLDLGRIESLLGLPCVPEAANIYNAGPELKRWCNLLVLITASTCGQKLMRALQAALFFYGN